MELASAQSLDLSDKREVLDIVGGHWTHNREKAEKAADEAFSRPFA